METVWSVGDTSDAPREIAKSVDGRAPHPTTHTTRGAWPARKLHQSLRVSHRRRLNGGPFGERDGREVRLGALGPAIGGGPAVTRHTQTEVDHAIRDVH